MASAVETLKSVIDEAPVVDLDAVEQFDEEDAFGQEIDTAAHSGGNVEGVCGERSLQEFLAKTSEQSAEIHRRIAFLSGFLEVYDAADRSS